MTPHSDSLRLGVSSLERILSRDNPRRRLVDEATLLECSLTSRDPAASISPWRSQFAGFGEAAIRAGDVAERELFGGWLRKTPTDEEVATAEEALRACLIRLRGNPRPDVEPLTPAPTSALGRPDGELPEVLFQLEVVQGRLVEDDPRALSPGAIAAALRHNQRYLRSDGPAAIVAALGTSPRGRGAKAIVAAATSELRLALARLHEFQTKSVWPAGVLPLPAIELEPDVTVRLRLVARVVEFELGWILPRTVEFDDAPELAGAVLADRQSLFVGDVDNVKRAFEVRNRLVRTLPDSRTLRVQEIEEAERALTRAAYELRRHVMAKAADLVSRWRDVGEETAPLASIETWKDPRARMIGLRARLEALVAAIEMRGVAPVWAWCRDGEPRPIAVDRLRLSERAASVDADVWPAIDLAHRWQRDEAALDRQRDARLIGDALTTLAAAVRTFEHELGWTDWPLHADRPSSWTEQYRRLWRRFR